MSRIVSRSLSLFALVAILAACGPASSELATVSSPPTATATSSAPSDQEITTRLDSFLTKITTDLSFAGAVLVAKEGKILLSKGYGEADRERRTPNTAQTKFRIASITKQFTAMAILILQARGELDVHDRVCDYISECPLAWQSITLHHLLTHTSGIPDYYSSPDWETFPSSAITPSDIMARFRGKPLDFQPGEDWNYSNSGYVVLGCIIERVSGMTYGGFLQENVFFPLKMMDSGYLEEAQGVAIGYSRANTATPAKFEDMSGLFAAGGLYSTVGDLYLWEQALYTDVLIPKELREAMFTPYTRVTFNDEYEYGYGWLIGETANRRTVGHMGRIEGFTSINTYYPDDRVAVIALSNQRDVDMHAIGVQLADIVFGLEGIWY